MNAAVDPYAIEHASLRARLLSITAGFPPDAIEDARQDLLLDYLRRLPKYDGARGGRDGFVRGVMRNHATVLITRRHRRVRWETLAGDLPASDGDNPGEFLETIASDDAGARLDIRLDVQRVLRQLPDPLQRLAYLLPHLQIAEVCSTLGKSRSRVYQMIRQIRSAFIDADLGPPGGCG